MPEDAPHLDPEMLQRLQTGLRIMAMQSLSDPEAAEEAVQETLTRMLVALRAGRLKDPNKLAAFARGIARHVFADVHRARYRMIPLNPRTEEQSSTTPEPLEALISVQERQRLRFALAGLSEGDREILRLSFHEGMSPSEIAGELGEPPTRIRKRKSRAVERLRRAFFADGHDVGHDGRPRPTVERVNKESECRDRAVPR